MTRVYKSRYDQQSVQWQADYRATKRRWNVAPAPSNAETGRSCMTFGAHKRVRSEPFLVYIYEIWQLLWALYSDVEKILYRCTSTFSALNYYSGIFSNLSAIYTKWCPKLFPPIFGLFAIFDGNFTNIVAPSSDDNKNCAVHVKGRSFLIKYYKPH